MFTSYMDYSSQIKEELNRFSLSHTQIDNCLRLYEQYNCYMRDNKKINWEKVEPMQDHDFKNYNSLNDPSPTQLKDILQKTAVLKLNGGLGTSMGCDGPKSLLPVRDGMSFLDFTLKQIQHLNEHHGVDVPLVLMNSFNTDDETKAHLAKVKSPVTTMCFNQFELPRMDAETRMPAHLTENEQFYPPGHGYVYECLRSSNVAKDLLQRGVEWVFISNADNLGAVLDPKIAHFCQISGLHFVSEQTPKTLADVKGGVLMKYDGAIHLLETAQVPTEHIDDFCNVSVFKYFNVNNLWINLPQLMKSEKIELDLIVNPKTVEGKKVIQLEVAAGAAIANFASVGLVVPRKRFQPVKKSGDLLLLQSDCFEVTNEHLLKQVTAELPLVNISCKVGQMYEMFPHVPSLIKCKMLEVNGTVTCGKNVKICGNLIVNKGELVVLRDSEVYSNE